jgi:hypothetical protein|tara:strand:+ start:195 stop:875 length:681 start_codon:yes stop_codon:yes gene_type:complete
MKKYITEEPSKKEVEGDSSTEIDLDKVGIDEDFDDGLEGSKVITKNQVFNTKPKKTEWFRVMGNNLQEIKKGVSVAMMAADDREHDYYVYPSSNEFVSRVKEDFKGCKKFRHAMYKTSSGRYGIWPLTIPQKKFQNKWSLTGLDTIEQAQHSWVRVVPNMTNGHYDGWVADDQDEFPELKWELTPQQMISYAWDNFILTEENYDEHPDVSRALRGKSLKLNRLKNE